MNLLLSKCLRFAPGLALVSFICGGETAKAQGSLTPPGPPGPTMKSLAEIEPRNTISDVPCIVSQSGSYYFTANLSGVAGESGITILADNVTIDLNGFSLIGTPNASSGVLVSGPKRNIVVRNGSIRNWTSGIDALTASHSHFDSLSVFDNGGNGIASGPNCAVTRSDAYSNEGTGIFVDREGVVRDCTARANTLSGIQTGDSSQIVSSTASFNSGHGIQTGKNCLINACSALNNGGAGIAAGEGNQISLGSASNNGGNGVNANANSIVSNCFSSVNSGSGIAVTTVCQVIGCNAAFNGQAGISAGDDSTVSGSTASNNTGIGIATGTDSQVIDSKVLSNRQAGIQANSRTTIRGCTAQRNASDGIVVSSECTVVANSSNNNFNARDASGIHATGTDNVIRENNVISNDRGFRLDAGGNLLMKNSAANNTINYFITGTQTMGEVFQGPGPIDRENPWLNFEF